MADTESDAVSLLARWVERARQAGGITDAGLGRRRHLRVTWGGSAELVLTAGGERRIPCRLRDVSLAGVGLHCREQVPVGAAVRVYLPEEDEFIEGEVIHCTMTVGGFKVGVRPRQQVSQCQPGVPARSRHVGEASGQGGADGTG